MTLADARKLVPGLYLVYWKGKPAPPFETQQASLAAVEQGADSDVPWCAPTNWLTPDLTPAGMKRLWRQVERVEPFHHADVVDFPGVRLLMLQSWNAGWKAGCSGFRLVDEDIADMARLLREYKQVGAEERKRIAGRVRASRGKRETL